MPRSGTRPHTWKVKGDIPHQQYRAWQQTKAQASFREEEFSLSFEEYQKLWDGLWHLKGRGVDDYCLTRDNPDGAWEIGNVSCIPRIDHLRRQKLYKMERNNGRYRNGPRPNK